MSKAGMSFLVRLKFSISNHPISNYRELIMSVLNFEHESKCILRRFISRVEKELSDSITADAHGWQLFVARLQQCFPSLFNLYLELYGTRYDFFSHLEDLLIRLARSWFARPNDLRDLDKSRDTLTHVRQDGSFLTLLRSLARTEVLILDDWMRDPILKTNGVISKSCNITAFSLSKQDAVLR
jgi:hypothetical protein